MKNNNYQQILLCYQNNILRKIKSKYASNKFQKPKEII